MRADRFEFPNSQGHQLATRLFTTARHPKSFISAPADSDQDPRTVTVTETGAGTFQQLVTVGPHQLRADEPVSVGGLDTRRSPYDLLLALSACTAMMLRLYADRKDLPLERVSVRLRHSTIHAADCASCENAAGKVDRIDRVISLDGDLDEAQRIRLREIADRCPVHSTLHSEIGVQTRGRALTGKISRPPPASRRRAAW